MIKARHSGLVLQVASNESGADITQQADTNATSQHWRVTDHGSGIVSLINRQSGLAMDVWERSTADGARISQWAYNGGTNQRFIRRGLSGPTRPRRRRTASRRPVPTPRGRDPSRPIQHWCPSVDQRGRHCPMPPYSSVSSRPFQKVPPG